MLDTLDNYSMVSWTGDLENPEMVLETFKEDVSTEPLEGHSVVALNQQQSRAFLCDTKGSNTVSTYGFEEGAWVKKRTFEQNDENILMLEVSKNEKWCCATILNGFKLWHVDKSTFQVLLLPNGVRNNQATSSSQLGISWQ